MTLNDRPQATWACQQRAQLARSLRDAGSAAARLSGNGRAVARQSALGSEFLAAGGRA
jgi:hypothetical protein